MKAKKVRIKDIINTMKDNPYDPMGTTTGNPSGIFKDNAPNQDADDL